MISRMVISAAFQLAGFWRRRRRFFCSGRRPGGTGVKTNQRMISKSCRLFGQDHAQNQKESRARAMTVSIEQAALDLAVALCLSSVIGFERQWPSR
jgi:hypothetical protein